MSRNYVAHKTVIEREIQKLELENGRVPFDDLPPNMRLKNYREDLLERLKDADYAAEYLAQVLAEKDRAAFLVALKDVVEATGGISVMAKRVGLKRPSLYKVFSKKGNPTLETLQAILEALGLRVTVATAKTA